MTTPNGAPTPAWLRLDNRRILVTGASKGIGRASALAMAELGAHITALARSEDQLVSLMDELTSAGAGSADYVVADLDDRGSLASKVTKAMADRPFYGVVHNTGGPPGGPLHTASVEDILHALHRHLLSAQTLLQLTLPGMKRLGAGRYIQILSTSVREPIDNLGVSNLTRSAMASWSKTLSRELPPGITINNMLPGFTGTQRLDALAQGRADRSGIQKEDVYTTWRSMVPEGRIAAPEEPGRVVAFLCTEAASYIRGQSIAVDGGRLRSI